MPYVRKTTDEYRLHVNYGQGWEYEVNESTRKAIRERRKEYAENCPEYPTKITGPHRVKRDITPVIFKKEGKDVVAFFPSLPGTGPHDVTCYAHMGQHASAGLDYLAKCKPATPAEYAPLKRELESAPYHYALTVVRRRTREHDKARAEACKR